MPRPPLQRAAPAKINLGLRVLRRRPDGFHAVETVLAEIGWADGVRYDPEGPFRFTCSDPALPSDDGNLCVRAARRLAEAAGHPLRGHLHLDKHVPYGAGLGSGSSDAAHTLRLLAEAWGLDASPEALQPLAAALGSDVPFFLWGGAALATGRGEVITPLPANPLQDPEAPVLAVVVPPVHVSTAEAYGLVTPRERTGPALDALVGTADWKRWREALKNDFEAPIAAAHPPIGAALQGLRDAGALYAALSGSGAAVFGLFASPEQAERAAEAAAGPGARVWVQGP